MQKKIELYNRFLCTPLSLISRILVVVAALILLPTFFTPLWHLNFDAPQFPDGLNMYIYSSEIVGGNDGNDLTEINILNHYIGMKELHNEDFKEFVWIPLVIVLMIILTFRAAILGVLKSLIDLIFFASCFGVYSMSRFYNMLYSYGNELDPKAAIDIEPFTPPIFGTKMVGQFTVQSFPSIGIIFFSMFVILILVSIFLTYKQKIKTI